jgi:hypothetical protein
VTTCKEFADGCIQFTHIFNRAKGQRPWVVKMPLKCPSARKNLHQDVQCDAYVLNRRGQAVCLIDDKSIRAVTVLHDDPQGPLGLQVLKDGYRGHYTFSEKSSIPKEWPGALYLPE